MKALQKNHCLLLFLAVFSFDFLSKFLTKTYLPLRTLPAFPYGGVAIFENFFGISFCLHHQSNTGAAWGFFADYPYSLLFFRIVFVGALSLYLYKVRPKNSFAFILILAGALGNIVDIFLYGHVIDMLHFTFWGYHYPVFNFADTAIFIGVLFLLLFH